MGVRRISVRIERVVMDAGAAEGRSAPEAAESLVAALREVLPALGAVRGGEPGVVDRMRVTAQGNGLDAVARAASQAVGQVVGGGAGAGRTASSGLDAVARTASQADGQGTAPGVASDRTPGSGLDAVAHAAPQADGQAGRAGAGRTADSGLHTIASAASQVVADGPGRSRERRVGPGGGGPR
ncbi:hypothetical protein ACIBU0_00095 [Streptomyces sp. NPDC049627]|uniref:hypothetical protein n=1 Tax=Streptomyces sp. NPDC049627 TaxID=3365595 RepID=UPI0037923037